MIEVILDPLVITSLILFFAYLVRGVAGFGSGLIAIPLLAMQHPLTVVVPMVVLLDYLGSSAQGVSNYRAIRWKELLPLLPFTLAGCIVALYMFTSLDAVVLKQALGWFILVFAVYQILPLPVLQASRVWSIPTGFFGGFVGTLFGTGGPFYMVYLSMRGLDKAATRACFATYFFVDGSIRLLGFVVTGLLSLNLFSERVIWLLPAALGLFLGGRIHSGISNKTFKYLISIVLLFSGFKLLTQ